MRGRPFFVSRNNGAAEGFAGSIRDVGCVTAGDFDQAPPALASSPDTMGESLIDGVECDSADVIAGICPP